MSKWIPSITCRDCGSTFGVVKGSNAHQDKLCSKCWPKHYGTHRIKPNKEIKRR